MKLGRSYPRNASRRVAVSSGAAAQCVNIADESACQVPVAVTPESPAAAGRQSKHSEHFRPGSRPAPRRPRDHDPASPRPLLHRPPGAQRSTAQRGPADAGEGALVRSPPPDRDRQGARWPAIWSPTRPARCGRATRWRCSCAPPSPQTARVQQLGGDLIVYADPSLVVVRKPAGLSTVPFGDEPPGTE